jgi:ferric-dicitrate binding protein FerR (iron transport regulator)
MESHDKIVSLIKKYLANRCDKKELDELIQLLHQKDFQQQTETLLYEYWQKTPSFQHKIEKSELDEMLNSIHHQINLAEYDQTQNRGTIRRLSGYLVKVAAILFVPLLLGSLWFVYQNSGYNSSDEMVTLETPLGSKLKTTLPDGTEVWQNAGTTLQYPNKFTRKNRMVYLSGEAYFHVQSDKLNPFFVHTENGSVKVTGTRFNVSAFAEDGATTVVLEEGEVAYNSKKSLGITNFLKPGEQVIDEKSNNKVTKRIADVEKHIAWKDGRLVFRNDPLAEVAIKLRRWYGADIELIEKNDGLKDLTFTLTIEQETLPQVLEYLAQAAPLKIGSQKVDKENESSLIKTRYTISNK